MKIPRLEVYLDEAHTLCIAKVDKPGAEPRLILDIALEELQALDPADAAYRVGGTVLNILRVWHKENFGTWQVPAPPTQEK